MSEEQKPAEDSQHLQDKDVNETAKVHKAAVEQIKHVQKENKAVREKLVKEAQERAEKAKK